MIPPRAEIEHLYTPQENDIIDEIRLVTEAMTDPVLQGKVGRQLVRELWPEELERIANTHWISTKEDGLQLLKPNYAQKRFYKDVIQTCRAAARPIRGIILKARQLGFSTFIQSWQFEQCDEMQHRGAMTISYDEPSTEELHQKAKLIHELQWFPRPMKKGRARAGVLQFDHPHSSVFYTRTAGNLSAGRGITLHQLHCSEVPMWPDPEPVLVSVQQTVPARPRTSIFHESTAQGAVGVFYDLWNEAEAHESDYVPFFAPWFWDPDYALPFASEDLKRKYGRDMIEEDSLYMERYRLTLEQMAWREWKIRNELAGSKAQWQQEYPAEASEAFLTTGSPVFNQRLVRDLQANCTKPMWQGDIFLTQA